MKKTLAFLLAIVMAMSLSIAVFAAEGGSLTVTADNTGLSAKSEVTIKVSMADCAKCKSIALVFSFDKDVFEYVENDGYQWLVTGIMPAYDTQRDAAANAFASETNANGDLFTLKLKVKDDAPAGETTVSVEPTIMNGEVTLLCTGSSVKLNIQTGESESGEEGNLSSDVKAKYNASTPADVYSVDISWGAMEFDYNAAGQVWDAEAHKYVADENAPGGWAVHNSSNTITLKNNSSKSVDAAFTFTADNGYSAISGKFTYSSQELKSALTLEKPAEDTEAAPYVVSFMPAGALVSTHSTSAYAKIGAITITLD